MMKAQDKVSHGREGWFTPAALNGSQAGRGQATLPNHEIPLLESDPRLSVRIRG